MRRRYDILFSDDAKNWRRVRTISDGDGGSDPIALPESETRYVRLAMHRGNGDGYCMTGIAIKDLAWAATPNAFFQSPKYFSAISFVRTTEFLSDSELVALPASHLK